MRKKNLREIERIPLIGKARYLRIYNSKTAFLAAFLVGLLMTLIMYFFASQFLIEWKAILGSAGIGLFAFAFGFGLYFPIFRFERRMVNQYGNNFIFDQKYISEIKKYDGIKVFKSKSNIIEMSNFFFLQLWGPVIFAFLISIIIVLIFILYGVISFGTYPEYRDMQFQVFRLLFGMIGGMMLFLYLISFIIALPVIQNNVIIIKQNEMEITIASTKRHSIRNVFPYDNICSIREVDKNQKQYSILLKMRGGFYNLYPWKPDCLFLPTFKRRKVIEIKFYEKVKILNFVYRKEKKRKKRDPYNYYEFDRVFIYPIENDIEKLMYILKDKGIKIMV